MWEEERGVDVALNCTDGITVWAHKLVLRARCPYLSVLLISDVGFGAGSHVEEIRGAGQFSVNFQSPSSSLSNIVDSHSSSNDTANYTTADTTNAADTTNVSETANSLTKDWMDKCAKIDVDMASDVARAVLRWMYTDEFDLETLLTNGKKKELKEETMAEDMLSAPRRSMERSKHEKKQRGKNKMEEKASVDEEVMEMTMRVHQAASDLDLHAIRLVCEFSDHLPTST